MVVSYQLPVKSKKSGRVEDWMGGRMEGRTVYRLNRGGHGGRGGRGNWGVWGVACLKRDFQDTNRIFRIGEVATRVVLSVKIY